jgi:hypothetical protein
LIGPVIAENNNRKHINPSLLIPVDATYLDPRDRVFPSIFRSPLPGFHLLHGRTYSLLQRTSQRRLGRKAATSAFIEARAEYLSTIDTFTQIMRLYREQANAGQNMSMTSIKLIAGLPGAMQRLVDGLPGRFAFMNEAIKGEEVFSNVGQVATGSSLSRFASAKDDNDKKIFVWGFMTDDAGQLNVSLRDFRPHILRLAEAADETLARQITQDFVTSYVDGLQQFAREMHEIVQYGRSSA